MCDKLLGVGSLAVIKNTFLLCLFFSLSAFINITEFATMNGDNREGIIKIHHVNVCGCPVTQVQRTYLTKLSITILLYLLLHKACNEYGL